MDTVAANHVLFFFFLLTMRRSSLYLPIASLVNVQKMIKKKKEMDFGKVNTSIFPEDAKPSLTEKLALIWTNASCFIGLFKTKRKRKRKKMFFVSSIILLKSFFFLFFSEESDSKISFQFWTRFVKKVKGASDIVENVVELWYLRSAESFA